MRARPGQNRLLFKIFRHRCRIAGYVKDIQSVVRDCLSGNETAWSAFFTEYAPIGMNILSRRLADLSLDEKEDIIQNTFSKLLKGGLKNFRGSTVYEFLAYFRRIVMNEALTYLKSGRGWEDTISLDQEADRDQPQLPQLEVHDGNVEAYAGAKTREQLNIIQMVLEGSPIETKQVVLMKMEGYKDREIADIVGISPGTVASKYSRIKERIKKVLDRTSSGSGAFGETFAPRRLPARVRGIICSVSSASPHSPGHASLTRHRPT